MLCYNSFWRYSDAYNYQGSIDQRDLKTFVKLPFALYEESPLWVPQLILDDMEVFDRAKNPAFEYSDSRLFLATKDGKPVGRVAAINNRAANEKYASKNLRFGWFDVVNDPEVAKALMGAVEGWARELGMETLTGPHGFCDLDPQGMLIEGFDHLPTIAGYYNFPYYLKLIEGLGYEKEIDYIEFRTQVPKDMSAFPRSWCASPTASWSAAACACSNLKKRRTSWAGGGAVPPPRRGFRRDLRLRSPDREADPLLHQEVFFVRGQGPDPGRGQREGRDDRLHDRHAQPFQGVSEGQRPPLPFGWLHLLRALKKNDVLDFYLAGIKKQYRGMGVDLLMVVNIARAAVAKGFRFTESNQELETNTKIQAQWKYFNPVQHKRKRIFKKILKSV